MKRPTVFQKLLADGSDITTTLDLTVFVNEAYECLKPLVSKLYSAPELAASERVFSQAGLVIRPTRSRPSKAFLSTKTSVLEV